MRQQLVSWIVQNLAANRERLAADFAADRHPVRSHFAALDRVLPDDVAHWIHAAFPPVSRMRLMNSFREQKYTSKNLDQFDPLVGDALFAFQAPEVIAEVAAITGFEGLIGDASFYAGGISAMTHGQYLNPHLDNSHEATRSFYRRINVLFYCTPGWGPGDGGNLELWDTSVRRLLEIPSLFNRLVIMETNRQSWHSVNPVRRHGLCARCCVSNYYFSKESPEAGHDYFHVTTFSARPEQRIARLMASADNLIRSAVRLIKKDGLGRKDVYKRAA
jgi:Rps23 Pro-64 3,4-dihydroxylase Tpa1-like proline 4-hydroxylase